MDTRERIIKCFSHVGVLLEDTHVDIDINDYIEDSFMYIQFMVEVEQEFSIEFPDEVYTLDSVKSLNGLAEIVSELLEKQHT